MTPAPKIDLVLVDADVISKLAHWELLDFLPQAFDLPWHSFATTPSVQYRARKATTKPDRLFCSQAAAEAALNAVAKMSSLPAILDSEFILAAQRLPGLDPGEAVLMATASANPNVYVLTGDKRALAALAFSTHVVKSDQLNGRLICLEQFVLHVLNQVGLDRLRTHLCREPQVDRVIAVVMGSTCTALEIDVRDGLESYVKDAKGNSGTLLAIWPP